MLVAIHAVIGLMIPLSSNMIVRDLNPKDFVTGPPAKLLVITTVRLEELSGALLSILMLSIGP